MTHKRFNKKPYAVLGVIVAMGGFLLPFGVQAATSIHFDLEDLTIYEGDIFLADVNVSTPDTSINVIDGTILYNNNILEVQEVSTGGSIFAFWPQLPVFDNNKGILSFVGGVAEGFQGEKGKVLTVVFLAKSEGEAHVDFLDGFSVFLNDGQGTQINPGLRPLSLPIAKRPSEIPPKDEWQSVLATDTTPPALFEAVVGQDPSVLDNQYFISFFATDEESGIDHYEVQEGEGDVVQTESPYVLKDQSLQSLVTIKAVDKAGNERVVEFIPSLPSAPLYNNVLVWVIVGLLIILSVIFILWRNGKRKLAP